MEVYPDCEDSFNSLLNAEIHIQNRGGEKFVSTDGGRWRLRGGGR
jgi:hypothetical protein